MATVIASVTAHSWPETVAGGLYRGSAGANDLVKQRYYCPLASLAQCQPEAKHGITLTAENMRPCRTDYPKSSPMGIAKPGESVKVTWAGNGHVGAQAVGTCVSVSIAPYAVDPDRSAFTTIASCLPYDRNGVTDGTVVIPSNLPSGQYTVFWLWDFKPFWYSGCVDINVAGAAAGPATTVRPPVVTTRPPVVTTRPPVVTSRPPTPPTTGSSAVDCKTFTKPNSYCQSTYGASSFCMSWEVDKCGRSRCSGAPVSTAACAVRVATNLIAK